MVEMMVQDKGKVKNWFLLIYIFWRLFYDIDVKDNLYKYKVDIK